MGIYESRWEGVTRAGGLGQISSLNSTAQPYVTRCEGQAGDLDARTCNNGIEQGTAASSI